MKITDFPLIAITEVLDLPSTDNGRYDGNGTWINGPAHEIMEDKLEEVFSMYQWKPDEKFRKPCWIFERAVLYGSKGDGRDSQVMIGNGHHRVAFQAFVQGALFVHYSNDSTACS